LADDRQVPDANSNQSREHQQHDNQFAELIPDAEINVHSAGSESQSPRARKQLFATGLEMRPSCKTCRVNPPAANFEGKVP
jgi:hypothetical protein